MPKTDKITSKMMLKILYVYSSYRGFLYAVRFETALHEYSKEAWNIGAWKEQKIKVILLHQIFCHVNIHCRTLSSLPHCAPPSQDGILEGAN